MIIINSLYTQIVDSIITLDEEKTEQLVAKALQNNHAPMNIMNEALVAGIDAVGEKFKSNEYFIPELVCGVKAFQKGLTLIKPLITNKTDCFLGTAVIGTVKGDMHDIGKNIVAIMLEAAGFQVFDLGADVSAQAFADAAEAYQADIIALSALLTSTMVYMPEILNKLEERGLRSSVKVMVGGAVINQAFADRIGADGYSKDATEAVILAKNLLNKKRPS